MIPISIRFKNAVMYSHDFQIIKVHTNAYTIKKFDNNNARLNTQWE